MAKLVDAPDLGSGVLRRVGSSPIGRTNRETGLLQHFYHNVLGVPSLSFFFVAVELTRMGEHMDSEPADIPYCQRIYIG